MGLGVGTQGLASEAQQRAREPAGGERAQRRHGAQAVDARSAHQRQQQGLGLVVPVMGGQQPLPGRHEPAQPGVARAAGGLLEIAAATIEAQPRGDELHPELAAHVVAVVHPGAGLGQQAVIGV